MSDIRFGHSPPKPILPPPDHAIRPHQETHHPIPDQAGQREHDSRLEPPGRPITEGSSPDADTRSDRGSREQGYGAHERGRPTQRSGVNDHRTFSNLASSDEDIVGHIAYALYKGEKNKFKAAHTDPDAVQAFINTMNMPEQVASLRARAEDLLEGTIEAAVSLAVDEVKAEADADLNKAKQAFDARLKVYEAQAGFWRGVWQNTLANLAAAAITILLVVLVLGSKVIFWGSVADWFRS